MKSKKQKVVYVVGVDEVGRGPLAGPVTVCVFAVRKNDLKLLHDVHAKDSKQLSEQKRDMVNAKLRDLAQAGKCFFHIESSSPEMIDDQGINKAIYIAIIKSLEKLEEGLCSNPNEMDIYLDGGLSAGKHYFRQHTIIKGDATVPVISCASVLAKVHRDNIMKKYDLKYPNYGFYNHKGYGTTEHFKAIRKNGMTAIHRLCFLKNL